MPIRLSNSRGKPWSLVIAFPGYKSIMKHKQSSKVVGGIAIFIKDNITFTLRNDLKVLFEYQDLFA